MKTNLLSATALLLCAFAFAQSKVDMEKKNLKFYFPQQSYTDAKIYESSIQQLTAQLAPYDIDKKGGNYTENAPIIYLQQKNYSGLIKFSSHKKFPKYDLPLKSYAAAMIADPSKGEKFRILSLHISKKNLTPSMKA